MKKKSALFAFVSSLAVGAAASLSGCGGVTLKCQSEQCGNDTSISYEVCAATTSVKYTFGGTSCTCEEGSSAGCQTCLTKLQSYCNPGGGGAAGGGGDAGGGGASGGGGSGGGGGSASTACQANFTGGFQGTSSCAVNIVDTQSSSGWTISSAGNAIAGTSYSFTGFTMANAGTPATGSYDQTASTGTQSQVGDLNTGSPDWKAGAGQGTTIGSFVVNLSSLGSATAAGSGAFYQMPHGTVTATLVESSGALPDVQMTLTF